MLTPKSSPISNQLLASLPSKEYKSFIEHCEPVDLYLSETLNKPGKHTRHVYFPITSFVSLITPIDSQTNIEVGMVGYEGMVGLNHALGVKFSLLLSLVQGAGKALRMDAAKFLQIFEKSTALQQKLRAYAYVRMNQLAQTIGCNRFHPVDSRLACWMLIANDCAHSNEFTITHEFLSYMLGIRRAGISKSAGILQKKGLISYKRGKLRVLDRRGLEAVSCRCYQANKNTYKKIMR